MSKQADQNYTDPELRERLKDQIERGGKGGKPGQWSARKSQMLVKAYEEAGGGYKGEKDEAAESLTRWTKEDWQTGAGKGDAQHGHHMHRYLPAEVWDRLSESEQREAEAAKDRAKGQHVEWPEAVKREMKDLRAREKKEVGGKAPSKADLYARAKELNVKGRSRMTLHELQRAVSEAKS